MLLLLIKSKEYYHEKEKKDLAIFNLHRSLYHHSQIGYKSQMKKYQEFAYLLKGYF